MVFVSPRNGPFLLTFRPFRVSATATGSTNGWLAKNKNKNKKIGESTASSLLLRVTRHRIGLVVLFRLN